MTTKYITIEVSHDFNNEWFLQSAPKEKTDIIEMGTYIFRESKRKILDSPIKKDEIDKITCILQDKHREKLEEMQKKYETIKGENDFLTSKINHLKPQITLLKDELYKNENVLYDERRKYKKKINDEYESRIQILEDKLIHSNKEYQQREDEIRKTYEDKMDKIREQNNSIRSIYNNSSKKGGAGEINAYQTLLRLLPTAVLQDMHDKTGCGDIHIYYKDVNILYENKNYHSNNVPKKEIIKFIRDVTSTNNCDCGIMASQNTGIANRDNFSISYTDNGKPVLYLHRTLHQEENIKVGIELLVSAIKNNIVLDESKIGKIKNMLHTICELKKNNEKHRKNIEPFLNTYKENKLLIIKIENDVKQIIGHSPTEIEIISAPPTSPPALSPISPPPAPPHAPPTSPSPIKTEQKHTQMETYILWFRNVRAQIKNQLLQKHPEKIMDIPFSILVAKEAKKQWRTLTEDEKDAIVKPISI